MRKPPRGFNQILAIFIGFVWLCSPRSGCAEEYADPAAVQEQQLDPDAEPQAPQIRVDVSLVTTDVTVIGDTSRELRADDFIIGDNGVAQQITHFSRDLLPLSVALVIDRSTSIQDYLPLLQKAALSALGRLKPEDRVALFTFDDDLVKLSDLTTDHDLIARIVGKLTIGSGTGIYDALHDTARYLREKAPQSRRAIVFISDNCHTSPGRVDKDEAYIEVLETAATLYSIQTPGEYYSGGTGKRRGDPGCYVSDDLVKQLTEESGGESFNVKASKSLQAALENAISNLRLQYTLGFSPSDPGEKGSYHRLTVKLASENRCPTCRLLARRGYYSGVASVSSRQKNAGKAGGNALEPASQASIRHCITSAGTIDFDLPDIPMVVRTAKQKGADGKPQIKVDLHVNFSRVGFRRVNDRLNCKLHIAFFSMDAKGYLAGEEYRVLEGMLKDETYAQVLQNGMEFSVTIPDPARTRTLRVVIYDEATGTLGSKASSFP
jgi:Ca-activated chloride channel family protein